mgnify:CR=1 FL=1
MIDYSVYLVTDDPSRYKGNWLENVRAAVEGGVTCVQYRDTESGADERFLRVRALQDALGGRVPLVINNEPELAAAVRAEGVHVGQSDLPPDAVRAIVGPRCEIGLSLTCLDDLARLSCADAVGIGPVFDARKTKADASTAIGLAGLSAILSALPRRSSPFPNCAIGGITRANAAEVLRAGAGGLAVVSAFSQSDDPYGTARDFALLSDCCRQ